MDVPSIRGFFADFCFRNFQQQIKDYSLVASLLFVTMEPTFQITILLIYFRRFFSHSFGGFLSTGIALRAAELGFPDLYFSLQVIQKFLSRSIDLRVVDLEFLNHLLGLSRVFPRVLTHLHDALQ
jgi:hypothetical protein